MWHLDADDGVALCERVEAGQAHLRYIDVPGVAEEIRIVPAGRVRVATLSRGTRIWVPSSIFGWLPGEVTGHLSHGRYLVRLAGVRRELPLFESQLRVRWERPLADPSLAVANGLVEDSRWYDARRSVVANLVAQRAACRGFTAVLSAAVLPFQHQLDLLARVTGDPVMRFVLADEVGLGKTIEAGLIIRQLLLDDAECRVVVLAPRPLVGQWHEELSGRLLLRDEIEQSSRVTIAAHDDLPAPGARGATMLVIDEAHHLVERARHDAALAAHLDAACRSCPGLLLLTATPMRGNTETFLGLLRLVDPEVYGQTTLADFERRLRMRQDQATSVDLLTPQVPASLLGDVLSQFTEEYRQDPQLIAMLAAADEAVKTGSPDLAERLNAVAHHLREAYRISRRVVRHRRQAVERQGFPVSGRRPVTLAVDDDTRRFLDDFLDNWRAHLAHLDHPDVPQLFVDGVFHVLGGPGPALEFAHARLGGTVWPSVALGETEAALLRNLAALLSLRPVDARISAVVEHVGRPTQPSRKTVVFTSFTSQARRLAAVLADRLGDRAIAEHYQDMDCEQQDSHVYRFVHNNDCSVLVADGSAQEGRNFQNADEVINLDLPLSANELEQRLGRVDRFNLNADGTGTPCVVLTEPDSPWARLHLRFLDEAVGVLRDSVATLQRPLADIEQRLRSDLVRRGYDAFAVDIQETRRILDEERQEIDLLEELEATHASADFTDADFEALCRFERDSATVEDVWRRLTAADGGIWLPSRLVAALPGAFRYDAGRGGANVRGIPTAAAAQLAQLAGGIRAYDRAVAAGSRTDVRLMRVGDPLVDWIENYLRIDERGRARALIRTIPAAQPDELWFGFDFLVEFNDADLAEHTEADRRRLRRRGDAFLAPRIETVWSNGVTEAPDLTRDWLETPAGRRGVEDSPLRGHRWDTVLREFPRWPDRCRSAADQAEQWLQERPALAQAINSAVDEATADFRRRWGILRSRSGWTPEGVERRRATEELAAEERRAKATIAGLQRPRLTMLACAGVLLRTRDD